MPIPTSIPTSAIAYTRVSSEKQKQHGQSLNEQRLSIEVFAGSSRFRIEDWFDEVGSAYGSASISRRPAFQAAVEKAEKLGVPIVVASFDRISRDLRSFFDYIRHRDLTFISAEEGAFLTLANLEARIARAEAENRRRSESTKADQARRKAAGLPLRNPDLDTARKKSAEVRGAKAMANAEHLDTILLSDPDLADLSLQKLADRLNELGHYDISGQRWSKNSVHSARQRLKSKPKPATGNSDMSDEERAEMEKHPLFGMF